jgi:hypothetical protein
LAGNDAQICGRYCNIRHFPPKAGTECQKLLFPVKAPLFTGNSADTVSNSLNNPVETTGLRATKQQVNVTFWPKLNETTYRRQARGVLPLRFEGWKSQWRNR